MTTQTEALKLALEALRTLHDENMDYLTRNNLGGENNQCMVFARETITALRQAIEQAQKQEPVAWLWELTGEVTTDPDRADGLWLPLYATPPQRQPLTDEMVLLGAKALAKRHADSCGLDFDDVWKYYADEHKDDAKAVLLAAHGIKEKNT